MSKSPDEDDENGFQPFDIEEVPCKLSALGRGFNTDPNTICSDCPEPLSQLCTSIRVLALQDALYHAPSSQNSSGIVQSNPLGLSSDQIHSLEGDRVDETGQRDAMFDAFFQKRDDVGILPNYSSINDLSTIDDDGDVIFAVDPLATVVSNSSSRSAQVPRLPLVMAATLDVNAFLDDAHHAQLTPRTISDDDEPMDHFSKKSLEEIPHTISWETMEHSRRLDGIPTPFLSHLYHSKVSIQSACMNAVIALCCPPYEPDPCFSRAVILCMDDVARSRTFAKKLYEWYRADGIDYMFYVRHAKPYKGLNLEDHLPGVSTDPRGKVQANIRKFIFQWINILCRGTVDVASVHRLQKLVDLIRKIDDSDWSEFDTVLDDLHDRAIQHQAGDPYKIYNEIKPVDVIDWEREAFRAANIFSQYRKYEVAAALCSMSFDIFSTIDISELPTCPWGHPSSNNRCPGVNASVNFFNKYAYWVPMAVLSCDSKAQSLFLIEKFVGTCAMCLQYKGYDAAMALFSGLNHGSISRLSIWSGLRKKYKNILEQLRLVLGAEGRFGQLRKIESLDLACTKFNKCCCCWCTDRPKTSSSSRCDTCNTYHQSVISKVKRSDIKKTKYLPIDLDKSKPQSQPQPDYPPVPFMGKYFSDLVVWREIEKTRVSGHINVRRLQTCVAVSDQIIAFQQGHSLIYNVELIEILRALPVLSMGSLEKVFYSRSQVVQPKRRGSVN